MRGGQCRWAGPILRGRAVAGERAALAGAAGFLLGILCVLLVVFLGCARDLSQGGEGAVDLSLRLPAGTARTAGGDSLRIWILDGDGRSLLPPVSLPFDSSRTPLELSLRVPAGEDRAVWVEWNRPDSSRLGGSGIFRGSVAAGSIRGLSVVPGQVSRARVLLQPSVPTLEPIEASAGEDHVTLRWTRIEGAIEYGLLQEGGGAAAEEFGADTFRVLPLRGQAGFAPLAAGSAARSPQAAESTYFQVRSRRSRGSPSLFSNARSLLWSDLVDLPRVTGVLPGPDARDVADSSEVVLAFSQAMDAATLGDSTVTLRESGGGAAVSLLPTWPAGDTLRLLPAGLLRRGASYDLVVRSDLRDLEGRPLDQDPQRPGLQGFASSFRTEPYDPLRPIGIDPPEGAEDVDFLPTISVFLNRKARASTVLCDSLCTNAFLSDSSGRQIDCRVALDRDSIIQIAPRDSLRYFSTFFLTVTPAVRDLRGREGDPLDSDPATPAPDAFTSSFRTRPQPPEPVGPRVVSFYPASEEPNAPVFRPAWVRFSRPVATASVANNHLSIRELPGDAAIPSVIRWNADRTLFTVAPTYNDSLFKRTYRYRIVVTSGVLDDAGISFDQDSTARGRQEFSSVFRAEDSPAVLSHVPGPGELTQVPVNTQFRLTFSKPMSLASLESPGLVLQTGGIPVTQRTLSLSADSTVLTITPHQPLEYYRPYTLSADSSLLSTRGSRLDQSSLVRGYQRFELRFTTKYESLPPIVELSQPVPGELEVSRGIICMVRFDHAIVPSSVLDSLNFYLEKMTGGPALVTGAERQVAADSLSATLTPPAPLEPLTEYRLTVSTWVRDRFDTRLDQNRDTPDVREPFLCTFRTAAAAPPKRAPPGAQEGDATVR